MNIEKVIEQLRFVVEDLRSKGYKEKLFRLCRDVVHELSRNRPEILKEFRFQAAKARYKLSKCGLEQAPFADGVLAALQETCAAWNEITNSVNDERDWKAFIRIPGNRKILTILRDNENLSLKQLKDKTKFRDEDLKKVLINLRTTGLIKIDTGLITIYRLTSEGWSRAIGL